MRPSWMGVQCLWLPFARKEVALIERKGRWILYRGVMFAAAVSLAVYVPFKYVTQLHAVTGLYAFLFPLSSVLALGGMVLAVRPRLVFRLPSFLRAPVGVIAAGWILTGILCVPSLARSVLETPFGGLFASFHMLVQHVVLSGMVGALVMAPRATFAHFGLRAPERRERPAEGLAPERA